MCSWSSSLHDPGAGFNGRANNLILNLRHVQTTKKWLRLLLICYRPCRIYARKSIYAAIESRPWSSKALNVLRLRPCARRRNIHTCSQRICELSTYVGGMAINLTCLISDTRGAGSYSKASCFKSYVVYPPADGARVIQHVYLNLI